MRLMAIVLMCCAAFGGAIKMEIDLVQFKMLVDTYVSNILQYKNAE